MEAIKFKRFLINNYQWYTDGINIFDKDCISSVIDKKIVHNTRT